jgi:hypothetical protein
MLNLSNELVGWAAILFSHLRNWNLIDRSTVHFFASLTRQCEMSLASEESLIIHSWCGG